MKHAFRTLCALAAASTLAAMPVAASAQRVYDAADNIWYEAVNVGVNGITWGAAEAAAVAAGGFLATPTDASQNDFIFSLVTGSQWWTGLSVHDDTLGPWLGIYSTTPVSEGEHFVYVNSGAALGSFQPWGPNQPDGYGGGYQAVDYYNDGDGASSWGDTPAGGTNGFDLPYGYVIQFNASAVPEPTGGVLMLAGLAAFVAARRRQAGAGTRADA